MRLIFANFLWSMLLFGGVLAYSQLVANIRYLHNSATTLHAYAESLKTSDYHLANEILAEARHRALAYDNEIIRQQLVDGMVVNRSGDGGMLDQCDSLLFSSLRYVSIDKLGWHDRAIDAWAAIERSQDHGTWLRHPRCYQSISRDMLLGLLIAMTRSPPRYEQHLNQLMRTVSDNGGYFGHGPIYVSYLSPGLARLMATIAHHERNTLTPIPSNIESGYSTAELEVLITPAGYTSHLGGLTAWLEMELISQGKTPEDKKQLQFIVGADKLVSPFSSFSLATQRIDWITNQLVTSDPQNLFFRYLRLRSAGALNGKMRLRLLDELLHMRQFPRDRLPMDCDRRSDYLWQRADKSLNHEPIACNVQFSGVDFLWMASLLLEEKSNPIQ